MGRGRWLWRWGMCGARRPRSCRWRTRRGESLFLAAECLELEGRFADLGVEPELVDPSMDAIASLDAASEALATARSTVPLILWAGLQAVRARASR